jgi:acyl carrier protein
MGLDTVELVLDVEDRFGITIDDDEAAKICTPGDVADYVIRYIRLDANAPCRSRTVFYRMRSVLMQTFGIPRKRIRPSTRIDDLWEGDLRDNWKKLKTALGNRRFPWLRHTPLFIGGVIFGIPVALAFGLWFVKASFAMTLIVPVFTLLLIAYLTNETGTLFPEKLETVGSLLPYVTTRDIAWKTRDDVLKEVIRLVSEQQSIPVENIHEHSRYVEDLRMD